MHTDSSKTGRMKKEYSVEDLIEKTKEMSHVVWHLLL